MERKKRIDNKNVTKINYLLDEYFDYLQLDSFLCFVVVVLAVVADFVVNFRWFLAKNLVFYSPEVEQEMYP